MVDGKRKFVVACGGTGGHSFPGLAVAKELLSRGHEVTVWMSGRSVESSVLKGWEGAVFATGAKQLSLRGMFANLRAFFKCRKELKRNPPEALLAMGSYSSVAPVLAAAVRGLPVVLHEANTVPGRAVDFLSYFVIEKGKPQLNDNRGTEHDKRCYGKLRGAYTFRTDDSV